ncbi:MAG TPA: phosphate ABC transporter permease subunit PstC [Streptosporangiaceae bacterium]|nr:phosphate ABC transporter permease subunit PstC [Streptosporangiaceae bacterium]
MAVKLTPQAPSAQPGPPEGDTPRTIVSRSSGSDKIFRGVLRSAGMAVLVINALILIFLILRSLSAFQRAGFGFFTTRSFFPETSSQFGIAALLPGSAEIAVVALLIAVPTGIGIALFISEYAPPALRGAMIAVIDLMAAIPSVIYALWGLFFLMPRILGFDQWLSHHLAFIPVFRFSKTNFVSNYAGAPFIAGVVVSLMVIPIITSLSRQVFSQAPQGEREAAYALGSTKWGMIRTVVLPFGRGGVIGASMLGLGRALGETIAVTFILTPIDNTGTFNIIHALEGGGNTITAEIANFIFQYDPKGKAALLACGLVLFASTLIVNSVASVIVSRSRSGAATQD